MRRPEYPGGLGDRRRGPTQDKTDTADALAIARLLLAEAEHLPQIRRDDQSTELRIVIDPRDNLVGERTRLINQLYAQMLQVDPQYQEWSGPLTNAAGRLVPVLLPPYTLV